MSERWQGGSLLGTPPARPSGPLVVKVGGSLLTRPRWPEAIAAALATASRPFTVVVGGGPLVNGLRAIDAAAAQPEATLHWLAIEALGITARLVAEAVGLPLVADPAADRDGVLDVPRWLRNDGSLPVGWQVTSDSIAAVVARATRGPLLLVKSVPPPAGGIRAAEAAGWVDAHFPVAAATLPYVGWLAPISPMPAGRSVAGP
jgi:aspartokinase-like uncharacterized kinase